jgi:hypothetical protein
VSGYDGDKLPSLAIAAAALIVRQAPGQLIGRLESACVQLDDPVLAAEYADVLAALRALQGRCEVAIRRLEGEAVEIDARAIPRDGDAQAAALERRYESIAVILETMMGLADTCARDYYDIVPAVDIGPAGRALSAAVLAEIGGYQESVHRLRSALEVFR